MGARVLKIADMVEGVWERGGSACKIAAGIAQKEAT